MTHFLKIICKRGHFSLSLQTFENTTWTEALKLGRLWSWPDKRNIRSRYWAIMKYRTIFYIDWLFSNNQIFIAFTVLDRSVFNCIRILKWFHDTYGLQRQLPSESTRASAPPSHLQGGGVVGGGFVGRVVVFFRGVVGSVVNSVVLSVVVGLVVNSVVFSVVVGLVVNSVVFSVVAG